MANEKIPKWFTGRVYDEEDSSYGNGIVRNPFSGEEYKLTPLEMSIYDYIKGGEYMSELGLDIDIQSNEKAVDWFKKNNPEAYKILIE